MNDTQDTTEIDTVEIEEDGQEENSSLLDPNVLLLALSNDELVMELFSKTLQTAFLAGHTCGSQGIGGEEAFERLNKILDESSIDFDGYLDEIINRMKNDV